MPDAAGIDGAPHRARRVGIFGRRVEERTAPPASRGHGLADAPHDGRDRFAGRLLRQRRHRRPSEPVLLLDVGDDEIILGGKVIVERRLGHAGFGDDAVDAYGVDAPLVEKPGRRVEQASARGA